MEKETCPFCWGKNTLLIDKESVSGSKKTRSLMECVECEKFYWDGTEEEVINLSEKCKTKIYEPKKCYEDVKNPLRSGFLTYPKQKVKEFNQICSVCPDRKFVAEEKITHKQIEMQDFS